MRARRILAATSGAGAAVLMTASLAWACTGQPVMQLAGQAVGEPGSKVALNVLPSSALEASPVSVRWNALDGPELASAALPADGGTLTVTVPDVAPGVYYLVLDAGDAGVGRAAYQVTNPAGAPAPERAWDPGERPSSTTAAPLAMGMGLLAVGLVGLAGFGLVAAARSRALARRIS